MLREFSVYLLDLIIPPRNSELLLRTLDFERLTALREVHGLPYHDPRVTALVWELKYHASKRAATLGGQLIAEEVVTLAAEELGVPLLIPIPMHPHRRKARGHNQTELLCEAMLRHIGKGIEYAPTVLARTVSTTPQQGLLRSVRLKNVKHSMRATPHCRDRVCIVVDDVTTTGATLEEAKRALLLAGARAVHTVALAYS